MNLPELFSALAEFSLLQGVGLGITLAFVLSAAFTIRLWQVSLPLLALAFGILGVVVAGFFPAYYGLLVWFTGFLTAGMLALGHHLTAGEPAEPPLTPLTLVSLISAPLLITAVTGLLAFWPRAQIGGTFELSWIIFLLIGLGLWQIGRRQHALPRTAAFVVLLAGLALWQALRLGSPAVILIWLLLTLTAALAGPLFDSQHRPTELNHEAG